jgi:type II secretory pathway pseudopilin PulG
MNIRIYNHLLKNLRKNSPAAGFTIVEVLVAAMLTMIVMGIAGTGLVNMLRSNYKASAASEVRNNVDRTVEFISDEVRRAEFIADELSKIDSTAKTAIEAKGGKVVLAIRLPEYSDQIIYYTKAASNPWYGPRVLYRYGPPLAADGKFDRTGVTPVGDKYTSSNWTHSPLVDLLVGENQVTDKDCDPFRNNEKPDNDRSNDPPGWKMLPEDGTNPTMMEKLDGFFVCVKGKLVMLRLNSAVSLTTKEKVTSQVDTTVYGLSAIPDTTTTTTDSSTPPTSTTPPRPTFECTGTSCEVPKDPTPNGTYRDDPKCDSAKSVCWKDIPVVVDKDASTKFAVKLNSTSEGKAELNVITPTVNSKNGNSKYQSIEIYTKDNLLRTLDISLSDHQVLYILKEFSKNKVVQEYHVVVTFGDNGSLSASQRN